MHAIRNLSQLKTLINGKKIIIIQLLLSQTVVTDGDESSDHDYTHQARPTQSSNSGSQFVFGGVDSLSYHNTATVKSDYAPVNLINLDMPIQPQSKLSI